MNNMSCVILASKNFEILVLEPGPVFNPDFNFMRWFTLQAPSIYRISSSMKTLYNLPSDTRIVISKRFYLDGRKFGTPMYIYNEELTSQAHEILYKKGYRF